MESGEHMPDKAKVSLSLSLSSIPLSSPLFNACRFDSKSWRYLCLNFHLYCMLDYCPIEILISSPLRNWQFVNELARVAAPGGTIIIVTWCHRDLAPSEESLQPWEKELLNKICNSYYLPAWCSTADYIKLLQSLSLQVINLSCPIGWKKELETQVLAREFVHSLPRGR